MRQNHLHPVSVRTIDKMKLYGGPLGVTFGGSDSDLVFSPCHKLYPSSVLSTIKSHVDQVHSFTMRAIVHQATHTVTNTSRVDQNLLDYFKEESIGVECNPQCGNCLCGKCALGTKQMSLKDERDYEMFKNNMKYDVIGTDSDPGPYWRVDYPWTVNKSELVDNKPAVLGVMNSTARKLNKDPSWKEIYETQLKELLEKGFAREVSDDEIKKWKETGGKTYYIAHQVALNPTSK